MPLFLQRIIKKHTDNPKPVPEDHLQILAGWAENLANGVYDSETKNDGQFIQRILVEILGYKESSQSDNNQWTVTKNQPLPSGGNVEVALGHFDNETSQIIAPFELKGAKTRDLDAIMSGRNKSPVQQAWEYAMDAKGAKWVLVSNYREIRLYAVGYGRKDYEVFNLSMLSDPLQYARFMLLLSAENLLGGNTAALLQESENAEKEITNLLYQDYKKLRLELIADITANHPDYPALDIIRHSQTILDRILFVAFAEKKNLLPRETIKDCCDSVSKWNPKPIWDNFKGLFISIDKGNPPLNIPGYNGGLFAANERLDKLNLSNKICLGFRKISEYDFAGEISVNILGHIFEQSISDLEEIKASVSGTEQELDKKKSKRKKDGIFYTPAYITRYIVEQAVGGWLNDRKKEIGFDDLPVLEQQDYDSIKTVKGVQKYNKKIEQHIAAWNAYKKVLGEIKVLDPACGSGAFLNEVFDYLYNEGQALNKELFNLKQIDIFLRWDTHILANNIYGVDINNESVEITKLSLWLKTANRGEKLSYLENNIKCGNSLIDDEAVAGDLAFKWEEQFPDIMAAGGFDVVVGNPPYVSYQSNVLSKEMLAYFSKNYTTSYKIYDLFALFIERAKFLIKSKSKIGVIVPSVILFNDSFSKLRKHLLDTGSIYNIVIAKDGVFKEAVVPTIIMIYAKEDIIEHVDIAEVILGERIKYTHTIDRQQLIKEAEDGFRLSKENINFIYEKLYDNSEYISLDNNILDIRETIKTGDDSKFISEQKLGDDYYPVIFGKNVERYLTTTSNNYIIYNNELKRPIELSYFQQEKIFIRRVGDSLIANIDNQGLLSTHVLYVAHNIDKNYSLKFILSLLNSKLFSFAYKCKNPAKGSIFPEIRIGKIREIKIPVISKAKQALFIEKANIMLEKNKELNELSGKFLALLKSEFALQKPSGKLEKWYLLDFAEFISELAKKKISLTLTQKAEWLEHFEKQKAQALAVKKIIDTTDQEIDQMVCALYNLTQEEIAIVEAA